MALDPVHVVRVVGRAWIRHDDGVVTPLRSGMRVALDASIVTDGAGLVELQGAEGSAVVIGHDREVQLHADVFAWDVDLSSARIVHADALGDMARALVEREADMQQETAIAVQNNDGNSFVRLFQMLQTSPMSVSTDALDVSRTVQAVMTEPQEDSADASAQNAVQACICTEGADTLPVRLVSEEAQAAQMTGMVLATRAEGEAMMLADLLAGSDGQDIRSLSALFAPKAGASVVAMSALSGGDASNARLGAVDQAIPALALADGAELQMSWVQSMITQGKAFDA